jgi:hypothetical protein
MLEEAVLKALEIVSDGNKKSDPDSFVNSVLADVADKTRAGEFDLGASVISGGVTELDKGSSNRKANISARKSFSLRRALRSIVYATMQLERLGTRSRLPG